MTYVRIATAVPRLVLGSTAENVHHILELWQAAERDCTALVVFPELALTGYTVQDLLLTETTRVAVGEGLKRLRQESARLQTMAVVGTPFYHQGLLFNAAAVIGRGRILGIVAKNHLPGYREFYDPRWFTSGKYLGAGTALGDSYDRAPLGSHLLFKDSVNDFSFGVEICEDLWSPHQTSTALALGGAHVILNPSASPEALGKSAQRRAQISVQSRKLHVAYAYVSSGCGESTSDLVFSGHAVIAEDGDIVVQNQDLASSFMIAADIDLQKLEFRRRTAAAWSAAEVAPTLVEVSVPPCLVIDSPRRAVRSDSFREELGGKDECEDAISMLVAALSRRVVTSNAQAMVVGISGGLDSACALLIAARVADALQKPRQTVRAVALPSLASVGESHTLAARLANALDVQFETYETSELCRMALDKIGHSGEDVVFENTQSRMRTLFLLGLANRYGGIMVGTSDMSELALGWSTFGGDHVAMYQCLAGVPKTMVRVLVTHMASQADATLAQTLQEILRRPISPELKSTDTHQPTEVQIGSYDLHDFFLYHYLKNGAPREKLLNLAVMAFGKAYKRDEIEKTLKVFWDRFHANQFKRQSMPDGPKIFSIGLSPRSDWRMPSDLRVSTS